MKKLISLLILLFFMSSQVTYAQRANKKKTDVQKADLFGKVKQIKEDQYKAEDKFGEIVQGSVGDLPSVINKYNDKGYCIESFNRTADGKIKSKIIPKYDAKGNQIEYKIFDTDGQIVGLCTYRYDENGTRIEENHYNKEGILSDKVKFKYSNDGNEIGQDYYQSDGKLSEKVTKKYNDNGNLLEEDNYNSDGTLTKKLYYNYDNKERVISIIQKNTEDTSSYVEFTHKYDDQGNNNIIEMKHISKNDSNQDKVTNIREFDKNGNWIKEIMYIDDIPTFINIRQIEYYTE